MARFPRLVVSISLAAAALALPSVARAAGDGDYVVRNGDTLFGIAAELGVPLANLLEVNGLTLTSLIVPGQHLDVPATTSGGSAPASVATYTVMAGDSLSGIAARHQVSLASLLAANGMTANSLISPGMEVQLPSGADASNATAAIASSPTDAVVDYAVAQMGKPYRFFTAGPDAYDCSGLTMMAYRTIGVSLVHHSGTQVEQGTAVDYWNEPLRAGDLVFLDGDWNGEIDHVGMALGPTTWVHASESHDAVVTGPLPPKSVIIAVRRFVPAG
ncbi:C40 family peptidase [soil metagenome]